MNRIAAVLPLLLLSSSALAQQRPAAAIRAALPTDANEAATASAPPPPVAEKDDVLISSHGLVQHSGWYVAPTFGTTAIDGRYGFAGGLRAAWLINHQFGIGLAGTGFEAPSASGSSERRVEGGYGGLLLQYIVGSNRVVHGFVDATIGGGAVCPKSPTWGRSDCENEAITFFMIEPTANVEINVASFMRVDVGAGYRFAAASSDDTLSNRDLSGLVARTNLVFGQF
jgi:hypothetical protein